MLNIYLKDEGNRTGTLTVYDAAGNTTTIIIYADIDYTNPTCSNEVSCTGGGDCSRWLGIGKSLTIKTLCEDKGSSNCALNTGGSFTYNDNINTTKGGAGGNNKPVDVYDNAGNSKNCPANQTVKIDKTRPVISNIGFSGYNNRQVAASCYDGESGVVNSRPVINTSSGWNTLTCQNNAGLTNSDSKYATYNSCKSGANTCRYNSCCYGSPYTCGGDYVSYTTQESIRYCNNSVSATTYNGYSCRGACTGNDCRGGSCEHMCYKTVTNYYWDSCAYYYNSCSASYCCTGSNTCAYGYD